MTTYQKLTQIATSVRTCCPDLSPTFNVDIKGEVGVKHLPWEAVDQAYALMIEDKEMETISFEDGGTVFFVHRDFIVQAVQSRNAVNNDRISLNL
jgi:hypothetical protein